MDIRHHPLYILDNLGHMLHLPDWVVCDRFEKWVWDTSIGDEPHGQETETQVN